MIRRIFEGTAIVFIGTIFATLVLNMPHVTDAPFWFVEQMENPYFVHRYLQILSALLGLTGALNIVLYYTSKYEAKQYGKERQRLENEIQQLLRERDQLDNTKS